MPRTRITIKELASELSLSTATVSLVLSGKGDDYRIAPATRARIQEAADRLGYRPNHLARSMRMGKTNTIGVVFPNIAESYMNHVLKGIESVAEEAEVSLMIATSSFNPVIEARNLETLLDRRVDGMIIVPYAPFRGDQYSSHALRRAIKSGTPMVAIDRYRSGLTEYAVVGADKKAAMDATSRLLQIGCRRPAYVGFNLEISSLDNRREGFKQALLDAGNIETPPELLVSERNPNSRDITGWLEDLHTLGSAPDGFLVSTDGLALKLRSLLLERYAVRKGREIPPIARFGEDPPYFPTGMISVCQPHEELGRRGTEMLFRLIAGEKIPAEERIQVVDMDILEGKK